MTSRDGVSKATAMPATPAWPPRSLPRLFVREPLASGIALTQYSDVEYALDLVRDMPRRVDDLTPATDQRLEVPHDGRELDVDDMVLELARVESHEVQDVGDEREQNAELRHVRCLV